MASHCQNCGRGAVIGHAVSHAKNRTRRLFKPNLQSLKVLKNGISIRVVFCVRCIQRLKKYGRIGNFFKMQYATLQKQISPAISIPSHKHIDRDKKKIEEIMKKEEEKWKTKEEEEKTKEEKKKEEKIKIEELVGKK